MSPRCRLRYVLQAVTLTNFQPDNQPYTFSNGTAELHRTTTKLHTCNYMVLVAFVSNKFLK